MHETSGWPGVPQWVERRSRMIDKDVLEKYDPTNMSKDCVSPAFIRDTSSSSFGIAAPIDISSIQWQDAVKK